MFNGHSKTVGSVIVLAAVVMLGSGVLAFDKVMEVVRREARREIEREVDKPVAVLKEQVSELDRKVERILRKLDRIPRYRSPPSRGP